MSGITHAKVSGKSDGADPSQVLPSDWNAAHVVTEVDIAAGGDTQNRLTAGLDGSNNPQILLGDGTDTPDVRLYRTDAGAATIDQNGTSHGTFITVSSNYQSAALDVVGHSGHQVTSSWYLDGDGYQRTTIQGDDSTVGMFLGSGASTPDLYLYRCAVSTLSIDANGTGGAGNGAAIRLSAMTSPGTPAAGYGYLYFSSVDKKLHVVNDAGVDTALG